MNQSTHIRQTPTQSFPRYRSVPTCWAGSSPPRKVNYPPLGRLITTRGDPPWRPPAGRQPVVKFNYPPRRPVNPPWRDKFRYYPSLLLPTTVCQKMRNVIRQSISSSNTDRFLNFFHWHAVHEICNKASLKWYDAAPHLNTHVATLHCDISENYHDLCKLGNVFLRCYRHSVNRCFVSDYFEHIAERIEATALWRYTNGVIGGLTIYVVQLQISWSV